MKRFCLFLLSLVWIAIIPATADDQFTLVSHQNGSNIGLAQISSHQTLEYSTDGMSWQNMTTATSIYLNNGESVYIRGMLSDNNSDSDYTQFIITGSVEAKGNINNIWNYADLNAPLKKCCGYHLFECEGLTNVSMLSLPATLLAPSCYRAMFYHCVGLTNAPSVLPATILADSCYLEMFLGCTNLLQAPELSATTLASCCYRGMFQQCTNLTTAPVLPAIKLSEYCYRSMFYHCTSLTVAPELPAEILTNQCYYAMFLGCTNLNYIKCLATNISATECTHQWLSGVASSGTFIASPTAMWSTGTSGIPSGWTSQYSNIKTWDGTSSAWVNGAGTQSDPYLIETPQQLSYLGELVNAGINMYEGVYFKQTADFDMDSHPWMPIGYSMDNMFQGKYDGNQKVIMNIHSSGGDGCIGLFGYAKNADFKGIIIKGKITSANSNMNYASAILAYGESVMFTNCTNEASINKCGAVCGGIVAHLKGTSNKLTNCVNTGNITAKGRAGGLVGSGTYIEFSKCENKGTISSQTTTSTTLSASFAGGLIGQFEKGSFYECFNLGNVSSRYSGYNSEVHAGGIIGYTPSYTTPSVFIKNCYVRADVVAGGWDNDNKHFTHGVAAAGNITNCYFVGSLSGVVFPSGSMNCYYDSDVLGNTSYSGAKTTAMMKSASMPIILDGTSDSCWYSDMLNINNGYPILKHQLPTYTITWQNKDGSLIDQTIVEYGQVPVHSEPTKPATSQYTYTFKGWNPIVVPAASDAIYTAEFDSVVNKYLITFRNDDWTVLKSEEVEYGVMPIAPTNPIKGSTTQYDYTFAGWTPTVAIVTQAATYTATYTSTLREYLVTFLNDDNTVISSKNYKYGETPVAPADPIKQNTAEYTYTFNGWDHAIAQVQGPQTYKATYAATKNSYTITWQDENGSLIDQTTVEYGVVPTHANPTKQNTAEYTYTFAGWTPAVVAVTSNATYRATFSATKNKYLITFRDENGTELKSEEIEYGVMPIAPDDPTKESTAQYDYTFAGWTPTVAFVTQAATYTATYTSALREYLVTFLNEDNTVISSKNYNYGETPIAPADPVKQNTAEYTYTFNGWDHAIAQVQGPQTYKATYTATKNSYTITWQDENGSLIDQTTVEYGQIPAHADPVKLNTAEYTYTFAGWTPAVVAVTGNATYKATFTATKNKYLITFRNDDGTVLKSEEVEYGMLPIAPATPTKESTVQYNYEFAGWTPTVTLVSQAATYTATYNSSVREYLITFLNDDNSIISMQSCKYGSYPTIPSTPTKNATAEYSYTFAGWTPNIAAVSGDVTYKAMFTATKNSYTITWQDENGSLIDQTIVEYGQIPAHADPVKLNTAEYTYTFAGWTPAVVAVTGNATYKATFTAAKNSYTITWQDENGSLIDQTTVEYGVVPTHANPTKQNTAEYTYTFAGWTPIVVAVTGNATYQATFTATKNNYTITWLDEDGSLIDQTTVEYGVIPTHADPTKEATAEYTYTFAGWTPAVVAVTGDATYTAKYNSVVNIYTITIIAINGQVLGAGECQYGARIDLTAIPDEGYVFDQWSDGVKDNPRTITVTGDAEYTALFTSTEGFENIYTSEPVQKVIIDQKVFILRGDKIYTLTGQEVK